MTHYYTGQGDPSVWFKRWFHFTLFGRSLTLGWVGNPRSHEPPRTEPGGLEQDQPVSDDGS